MNKKVVICIKTVLILLVVCVAACCWEGISSRHPIMMRKKRTLKYKILSMTTENKKAETAGLSDNPKVQTFVNCKTADEIDFTADSKRVYEDGSITRLVNYLDGYQMDLPAGCKFDFSHGWLYTKGSGDNYDFTATKETAGFQGKNDMVTFELSTFFPFIPNTAVKDYVEHYEYRFLLDEGWQRDNNVTVTSRYGKGGSLFITATLNDLPDESMYDRYLYATFYTGGRDYYRIMFRYHSKDEELGRQLESLAENFRMFDPRGNGYMETDYKPEANNLESVGETAELWKSLSDFSKPHIWGIYLKDFYISGFNNELPAIEKKLDYTFPVVLYYRHFPMHKFPTDIMQENYDAGRIVELTLQVTDNNNEDMFAHSTVLDIYRGKKDDELREWAREAAKFGHPFLFRLNNEMNSDWTSYGGVNNMADPEIFTAVWKRMFNIFKEEGADNCIWVFNPNDRPAPPSKWNNSIAYYPGNDCVNMIGVTGYNNGTYYTQRAEEWREFDEIYDNIWAEYSPLFSEFPWMITEFASSGVGGDKVNWIDNMFNHIGKYPNIRIAVWFSYADFDTDGTPARTYWLDETPETLEAFRRGLNAELGR